MIAVEDNFCLHNDLGKVPGNDLMNGLVLIIKTSLVKPAESAGTIRASKNSGKQREGMLFPFKSNGNNLHEEFQKVVGIG